MTNKEHTLTSFRKYSDALIQLLDKNESLDTVDEALIENHIIMLQMSYGAWRQRQKIKPPLKRIRVKQ